MLTHSLNVMFSSFNAHNTHSHTPTHTQLYIRAMGLKTCFFGESSHCKRVVSTGTGRCSLKPTLMRATTEPAHCALKLLRSRTTPLHFPREKPTAIKLQYPAYPPPLHFPRGKPSSHSLVTLKKHKATKSTCKVHEKVEFQGEVDDEEESVKP